MSALPELLPDGVPVHVGSAALRCLHCEQLVPVAVAAHIARDADGDWCVYTNPDVIDLEVHLIVHLDQLGKAGDDDG